MPLIALSLAPVTVIEVVKLARTRRTPWAFRVAESVSCSSTDPNHGQ